MKIHYNSVGYEIAYHAMSPVLQLLRNPNPDSQPVEGLFASAFRQLGNWKESSVNLGTLGAFPPRTLSKEEAVAVYGALDTAFQRTFPDLTGMLRQEMAGYITALAGDVRSGLKSAAGPDSADKQQLYDFLRAAEDLLEELESEPAMA